MSGNIRKVVIGKGKFFRPDFEIYSDSSLTTPLTNIDLGVLTAPSSKVIPCYVKNTGNVPMQLEINSVNWNPPVDGSIVFSTDYTSGTILNPGSVIQLLMTFDISSVIPDIDDFTFEIEFIGSFQSP